MKYIYAIGLVVVLSGTGWAREHGREIDRGRVQAAPELDMDSVGAGVAILMGLLALRRK